MLLLAIVANLIRLVTYPLHLVRRAIAAPRGSYVTVDIDGPLVDLPTPSRLRWFSRARRPLALSTLRELTLLIAHDARVRGVLVRITSLETGAAMLASLRDVLLEIRAAGKDVVVHLPSGADTHDLYVASAARLVVVGPDTMVSPIGYAVEGRYVRTALERVGVEPEVFAKGAYKSAGESLVRDTMSEAEREQVGALLGSHHDELVQALARGRSVDRETARQWIDEAPYSARRAIELGLVDAVAYDDELPLLLATKPPALADTPRMIPASRYLSRRRSTTFQPLWSSGVIGVVEIHGAIVSNPRFGLSRLASEVAIVAAIRKARVSRSVRAVVLHIDSRGGSAVASNRIHHEVARLAEEKPVVAYMANVAASGGYYVASAAHALVAQPQTITGSIGVVSTRVVIAPLLERLGVFTDVVKRGARADLFSTSRRLTQVERDAIERELDSFYQSFLSAVARGRGRSIDEIEPLARGRIYSGTEAHARGLLDHLGGFDRALHVARDLLGPRGKRARPRVLMQRAAGFAMPALGANQSVLLLSANALDALGMSNVTEAMLLGLEEQGRVLAYWSG